MRRQESPFMKFPRIRLSVRRLLFLVLVIGSGIGWFARQAAIQGDAVAAIRRAGGSVVYSSQWMNGCPVPSSGPWLMGMLEFDYIYSVKQVVLVGGRGGKADDRLMSEVGKLRGLEQLILRESKAV